MKKWMIRRFISILLVFAMLAVETQMVFAAENTGNLAEGRIAGDQLAADAEGEDAPLAGDAGASSEGEKNAVTAEAANDIIAEMSDEEIQERLANAADAAERPDGVFGFAQTTVMLQEGGGEGIVRVVRAGNTDGEASVVFKAVDISAQYGRDYTLRVVGTEKKETELPENPDMKPLLQEYGEVLSGDASESMEVDDALLAGDGENSNVEEAAAIDPKESDSANAGFLGDSLNNAYKAQTGNEAPSYDWKEFSRDDISKEEKAYMDEGYERTREELAALAGVSVRLEFAPGEYMKEIKVEVKDDINSESEEQILLVLQDAEGADLGANDNGYVNITDDDDLETVTYSVKEKNYIVGTDEDKAIVTIVRTSGIERMDIVKVGTKSETAKADEDYASVIEDVLFAPGVTEKTVTVNITATERKGLKSFWVGVKSESGALVENNACLVTIADEDYDLPQSCVAQEEQHERLPYDGENLAGEEKSKNAAEEEAVLGNAEYAIAGDGQPLVEYKYSCDQKTITGCKSKCSHIEKLPNKCWENIKGNFNIRGADYLRIWYDVGGYTDTFWYNYGKKRVYVFLYNIKNGKYENLLEGCRDEDNTEELHHSISFYREQLPGWDSLTDAWLDMCVIATSESIAQNADDLWVKASNIRLGYYVYKVNVDNSNNYYMEKKYTAADTYTEGNRVDYPPVYQVDGSGQGVLEREYKRNDRISTYRDEASAGKNSLGVAATADTVSFKGLKLKKPNGELGEDILPADFTLDDAFLTKYKAEYMDSEYRFTLVPVYEPKTASVGFDNSEAILNGKHNVKGAFEGIAAGTVIPVTKLDTMTVRGRANEGAGYALRGISLKRIIIEYDMGNILIPSVKTYCIKLRDNSMDSERESFTTHFGDIGGQNIYEFQLHYDINNIKVMADPKYKDTEEIKEGQIVYVDEDNNLHRGDSENPLLVERVAKGKTYAFGAMTDKGEGDKKYFTFWRDGTLDNDEDGEWAEDNPAYHTFDPVIGSALSYIPILSLSRLYYSFQERPSSFVKNGSIRGWMLAKENLLLSGKSVSRGINGATVTVDGMDTLTRPGSCEGRSGDGYYEIDGLSSVNHYLATVTYDGAFGSFSANFDQVPDKYREIEIDAGADLNITDIKLFKKGANGDYAAVNVEGFKDGYYIGWDNGDRDYRIAMTASSRLNPNIAKGELQFYNRDGLEVGAAIVGSKDTGTDGRFVFDFNPKKLFFPAGLTAKVRFTDAAGHNYFQRDLGLMLVEYTDSVTVVNAFTAGKPGIAVDIIGAVNFLMDAGWTCKFDGSDGSVVMDKESGRRFINVGFSKDVLDKKGTSTYKDSFEKAAKDLANAGSGIPELKQQEQVLWKAYEETQFAGHTDEERHKAYEAWSDKKAALNSKRDIVEEKKKAFDELTEKSTAYQAKDFKVGGKLKGTLKFAFAMTFDLDTDNFRYYFRNMTLSAGIKCDGEVSIKYTTPIAVTLGIALQLGGEGSACFIVEDTGKGRYYVNDDSDQAYNIWDTENGMFQHTGVFTLKPYIDLKLSAGILCEDLVNVTVDGKAVFDMVFSTAGNGYGDVTLSASIDIQVTLFHFKRDFVNVKYNMWGLTADAAQLDGIVMDALAGNNYLYEAGSSLQPEDVSYMSGGSSWYGAGGAVPASDALDDEGSAYAEKALADKIGEAPDFQMVSLGNGRYAAVFVNVPAEMAGDPVNSRAVYYTVYDGHAWDMPVILENDGTLDYFPRIYLLGTQEGKAGMIVWSSVNKGSDDKDHIDTLNAFNLHGEFFDADGKLSGDIMAITKNTTDTGAKAGEGDEDYSDRYSDVVADVVANEDGILVYYTKMEYVRSNQNDDYYLGDVLYPARTVMATRYYDYSKEAWENGKETVESLSASGPRKLQVRVDAYNSCMYGQKFFDYLPDVLLDEELDEKGYLKEGTTTTVTELPDGGRAVLLDTDAISYGNKGIFAYSLDLDGNLSTDADREVYYQVYDFATKEFGAPVIITGNGANDHGVKLVKADGGLWLAWLSDGDIVTLDLAFLLAHEDELLIRGDGYAYINKAAPAARETTAWPRTSVMVSGTKGDQDEEGNAETVSQISSFDVKASDTYMVFLWSETGTGVKAGVDPESKEANEAENRVSEEQLYGLRAEIGKEEGDGNSETRYGLYHLTDPVQITSGAGAHYRNVAFEVMEDGKLLGLAWKALSRLKTVEEVREAAAENGREFNEAAFVPYYVTDKEHAVPVSFVVETTSVLKLKEEHFTFADVVNGAGISFAVLNDGFDTITEKYFVKAVDEDGRSVLLGDDGTIIDQAELDGLVGGESRYFNGKMELAASAKSAKVTVFLCRESGEVLRSKEIFTTLSENLVVTDMEVENTGTRGEYLVRGTVQNTGTASSEACDAELGLVVEENERLLVTEEVKALLPGEESAFEAVIQVSDGDFATVVDAYGAVTETLTVYVRAGGAYRTETAERFAYGQEVNTVAAVQDIDLKLPEVEGERLVLRPEVTSTLAYEENLFKDKDGNDVKGMVTGGEALQYRYVCDSDCISIDTNNVVTALKEGSGTLRMIAYYGDRKDVLWNLDSEQAAQGGFSQMVQQDGYPTLASAAIYVKDFPFTIKEKDVFFTDKNGLRYKVTSKDKRLVTVTGFDPEKEMSATKMRCVTIPATVKHEGIRYKVRAIDAESFRNNKSVRKVSIGIYVKTIGERAFAGCTSLKKVIRGAGVTDIYESAFEGCSALASICLKAKVTTIGTAAFRDCSALKRFLIPVKVKVIGDEAFKGCARLKTLVIRSGVLGSIGTGAFAGIKDNAVFTLLMRKCKKTGVKRLLTAETGVTDSMKVK